MSTTFEEELAKLKDHSIRKLSLRSGGQLVGQLIRPNKSNTIFFKLGGTDLWVRSGDELKKIAESIKVIDHKRIAELLTLANSNLTKVYEKAKTKSSTPTTESLDIE